MAIGDDDDTIEPGNGRILGAGSNSLQRSIDSLNYSMQRLLTSTSGGMGGGGGRPPAVIAPAGDMYPEPQRPSGAIVRRSESFPAPVSWDDNGDSTQVGYTWGTPVRNSQPNRAATPQVYRAQPRNGFQWINQDRITKDDSGAGGSPPFNTRRATNTARRWVSRIQTFGNNQLRMALPMDNYAQYAAILAGSPLTTDGTDGRTVNSIRKFVFGSQGMNGINWARNSADASAAAFIATRNAGFSPIVAGSTSQINPAFASYLGNIKDLAALNPMMSAQDSANVLGTLSSTRGLYSAMMFGYRPVLGPGGVVDRNSLGVFSDSVMRSAYGGRTSVAPRNLAASLGQNGILNANIQAYVQAAGGDQKTVQALEDYITGRNTAAQHGMSGTKFDQLLSTYEAGGSAGKSAGNQLKKLGITNSILQSQKDLSAAKAENTSDLLDSFGPAIKKANEALGSFYNTLDHINNLPILKQLIGYAAGFGSVFGGAASTIIGGIGGFGASRLLSRGAAGALGGTTAARAPGTAGTVGRAATALSESTLALGGAAVFLSAAAGAKHWDDATAQEKAFEQWEKEENHVPDPSRLKGKQWLADRKKFQKLWDQAKKDQAAQSRTTNNDGIGGGASASSKGGGSNPTSGHVVNGKSAAGAISSGLKEIGKPYQWGGTGPDSWDCSGLMQHAYASIGVRLPRTSEQQMNVGEAVDRKDVRPGDLMFPYPGHVVMYLGGGRILEAPRTGENVRTASVSEYGKYAAIRRIVGSVGNWSGLDSSNNNAPKKMGDNFGGDSGSQVLNSGSYGSVEEVDAIQAALSAVVGAVSGSAQSSSASPANAGPTVSGPWKKDAGSSQKARTLGKQLAAQLYHWTGGEWDALDKLWTGESNWRWWADNPTSHAYGIVQALPGSKMASAGKDWRTNPATQIKWGLKYIHDRYGDPQNAYATWSKRSPHWYNTGAWDIPSDQVAMVHKGEMIIERPKADTIRNALMSDVVNVKSPGAGSTSKTGGQGFSLVFNKGSVVFNVSGPMTESQAVSAANAFTQSLANNTRMKSLAKGL